MANHFGHVTQLSNELDHLVPQKDSNVSKFGPHTIKSLDTHIHTHSNVYQPDYVNFINSVNCHLAGLSTEIVLPFYADL